MKLHPFIPGNLIRPNPGKPFANSSQNSTWTPLAIVLQHFPSSQDTEKLIYGSFVKYIDASGLVRSSRSMFPEDWETL